MKRRYVIGGILIPLVSAVALWCSLKDDRKNETLIKAPMQEIVSGSYEVVPNKTGGYRPLVDGLNTSVGELEKSLKGIKEARDRIFPEVGTR